MIKLFISAIALTFSFTAFPASSENKCVRKFLHTIRYSTESLPTLKKIEKQLDEFKKVSDPDLQKIYLELNHDIEKLKEDIRVVQQEGMEHHQLSDIVDRYNAILVFPQEFLSDAASRIDFHSDIDDWDSAAFKEVDLEWKKSRSKDGLSSFLSPFAEQYRKTQLKPKKLIDRNFLIAGQENEPSGYPFFFEYTYVFKDGYISTIELIRSRESGKVFIGVADSIRMDYDGQRGSATLFTQHDYFHAFVQKTKDNRLFKSLGITDPIEAERLRKLNSEKLDQMLAQWENISDKKLKLAVRALLFGLLHEQANSYPLQVLEELTEPGKKNFYYERLPRNLRGRNSIDPEASEAIKDEVDKYIRKAIEWMIPIAEAHSKAVKELNF